MLTPYHFIILSFYKSAMALQIFCNWHLDIRRKIIWVLMSKNKAFKGRLTKKVFLVVGPFRGFGFIPWTTKKIKRRRKIIKMYEKYEQLWYREGEYPDLSSSITKKTLLFCVSTFPRGGKIIKDGLSSMS